MLNDRLSSLSYQSVHHLQTQFEQAFSALLATLQSETTLLTQAHSNINAQLLELIEQKQPHLAQLQQLHDQASGIVKHTQEETDASTARVHWETLLQEHFGHTSELSHQWQSIKALQQQVHVQNQTNARLLQYREQRAERLHRQLNGDTTPAAPSYNQQGYGVRHSATRSQNQIKA